MTLVLSIVTALWFIFMTWLSHQDGEHTRETSEKLAENLSFFNPDKDVLHHYLRRVAHVIVFLVLVILLELTLLTAGKNPYCGVFPCLVWALIDEVTKLLIKDRHFSWSDVGLNLLGVGIGCVGVASAIWIL